MFWDGTSWIDESAEAKKPPPKPSMSAGRRRFRDWAATGVMGLALVGLIIPVFGIASASQVPTQLKPWVTDYSYATYQENRARVHYKGTWTTVRHPAYAGGLARAATKAGAAARITFDGTGVAWVGPVGPTRGKAKVYVDGQLVKTVDTHATHYAPTKILFKTTFPKLGQHTLRIVVQGTADHPTVAIDEFVVRGAPLQKIAGEALAKGGPKGRPGKQSPAPSPASTPAAAATPVPADTPAPTPVPTPTAASATSCADPDGRLRDARPDSCSDPDGRLRHARPDSCANPDGRVRDARLADPDGRDGAGVNRHHQYRRLQRDHDGRDRPMDRQRGRHRPGRLRDHDVLWQPVRRRNVALITARTSRRSVA